MKKMSLSLFLLPATSPYAVAQTQPASPSGSTYTEYHPKTPQENTEWELNWYSEVLKISDEQKKSIYLPVLKFQQEMAAAGNSEEKMIAVLAHHLYMVQEFQNLLTYTQYQKYQQTAQYPDGYINPISGR